MWTFLAVAFLVIPLVEIFAIIQVGQVIGAPWTIAILLVDSAIGAWIVKREGLRAWEALRKAVTAGHLPGTELADAALVLVGGALLLTPGFVTDAAGFFMVLPVTRPLGRRALLWYVGRRAGQAMSRRTAGSRVVHGEVVDD
jgi:UPF0716 protein FxsA